MTMYLLFVLAVTTAAFVAVWLYRTVFQREFFDQKVVSLSDGSGNFKPRYQQGFVRADVRTSRRKTARDKDTIKTGPIRKPWGW